MIDIENPEKLFLTNVIETIILEFQIPGSKNKKARLGEQVTKTAPKHPYLATPFSQKLGPKSKKWDTKFFVF